jgi:hypothetical protein
MCSHVTATNDVSENMHADTAQNNARRMPKAPQHAPVHAVCRYKACAVTVCQQHDQVVTGQAISSNVRLQQQQKMSQG